jgi:hypothetical protein
MWEPGKHANDLKAAGEAYGIEITWDQEPDTSSIIRCERAMEHDLAAATILIPQLKKYPPDFVESARIESIFLCKNLYRNSIPVAGLADIENQVMYLDLIDLLARPDAFPALFHHELFHMADPGHMSEWTALNKPGFRYIGVLQTGPYDGIENVSMEGFLNQYAKSNVWEDRAEIFMFMMAKPGRLSQRASNDPIIARKVAFMKQLVQDISPTMGDSYWSR